MSLQLSEMFDWITKELARQRPVTESMSTLIDQCESAHPHADWEKLRTLPYAEVESLAGWLEAQFREDPPDIMLKGLWFGLCNPHRGRGNPVADLRVSGAEQFDPTGCDWAVNAPWWPMARYAQSEALAEVYRIAYRRGASEEDRNGRLGNDAEYPLCLGYGAFALRQVFAEYLSPAPILGESESVGVMVGFDSGDFLHVGTLTLSGFVLGG